MTPPSKREDDDRRRVLVVDDDPVFRQVLTRAVQGLPGCACVGVAPNLAIARRRLAEGDVDAVLLDITLGLESGLDLLADAKRAGALTIIVTSGSSRSVRTEVDAVFLGAAGLIIKPTGADAPARLLHELERALEGVERRSSGHARGGQVAGGPSRLARREVIAVGASTGGPPVVLGFLQNLPAAFEPPIVIVQHLPETHGEAFAELLGRQSGRTVTLARDDEPLQPRHVYVAGNDRHLLIARRDGGLRARFSDGPPEHHCRPAVDPLFRSVAEVCGAAAVGVVATGMGRDGATGAAAMRARGAPVVVQDLATSVVWGMPGACVALDAYDLIAPGDALADTVARWTQAPGVREAS